MTSTMAATGPSPTKYNRWEGHSQTSAEVNLSIADNGTWEDAFQFIKYDDADWNLVGATFEMDVQLNRYDLVPLLSLSSANGRIVVDDPIQRVIHFLVPPVDIQANLKPGLYVYDLIMVYQTIVRVPLMHGSLRVAHGVTFPSV